MYGLMMLYLCMAWYIGARSRMYSFTIMLLFAVLWVITIGDTFSTNIRKTVLRIWAVTQFHVVVQDCLEATDQKLHVFKFLGLSALFEAVGMSLQQFSKRSLLDSFPPSLALAAFIHWALPQPDRSVLRPDLEDGGAAASDVNNHTLNDLSPSNGSGPGVRRSQNVIINPGDRPSHHTSATTRDTLPDPAQFASTDHFDLESLRSDRSHVPNRI
ncbi:hypothetical protein P153DRAFT_354781 [Dothidotthia symphoricarpi CBS 119687]|uniref:Uncharacterized protein n=1 Tax=Dothidotthia symphoricarpi CBS 119687 TaxID=1392245 RepID=A0A6A6AM21_9PLEO|nr:uncharacterized protein P153DRAFT_354781 [Dothidotthia symphoricarpi CBS 119687]KAF2132135.1 hypothetical protein P153DRAFT_354781 [Dothidotthia symphoricarpi CBS 119687]